GGPPGFPPPPAAGGAPHPRGPPPPPLAETSTEPAPVPAPSAPPPDPLAAARRLADAGRLDEAKVACERALATAPTAGLHSLGGVIHLASGRPDEAAAAFRKALYLDPDHPEALDHMAALAEGRGDRPAAAAFRRRLARLEPEAGA
ncbi:MAG: tetratricopeptide repeat protein, partial [Gemmataceae bacterium]|nr:tetratricopeptide repeat protein [Gemmataceae bacterium]